MSDSRPSGVIRPGASSGGDVAEQVIDDEGRPQDGFHDGPHIAPESVGVLPVVHKGSDESQTVDRPSAAAPDSARGLRRACHAVLSMLTATSLSPQPARLARRAGWGERLVAVSIERTAWQARRRPRALSGAAAEGRSTVWDSSEPLCTTGSTPTDSGAMCGPSWKPSCGRPSSSITCSATSPAELAADGSPQTACCDSWPGGLQEFSWCRVRLRCPVDDAPSAASSAHSARVTSDEAISR